MKISLAVLCVCCLSEYVRARSLSVEDLHQIIEKSMWEGLNPSKYRSFSNEESEIFSQFFNVLEDLSSGTVNPANLSPDFGINKKRLLSREDLKITLEKSGKSLFQIFEDFRPRSPYYIHLREFLKKGFLRCEPAFWGELEPLKNELKMGSRSPHISAIKRRLRLFGYSFSGEEQLFDITMLEAINDIQKILRRKPDGILSPNGRTWQYLNVSCHDRRKSILLNMEKLRWFPQDFPERYVFLNLASSVLTVVDQEQSIRPFLKFKIINGRPKRKTPTMQDQIVGVIVNPTWVVPPTIFKEDKLSEIQILSDAAIKSYFERNQFELWNKLMTKKLNPLQVAWRNIDKNAPPEVLIVQKPHSNNALGSLKFVLTNRYSVFLHDTNQKELFVSSRRQLSSGCIRLERPMELAEYLLRGTSWYQDLVVNSLAKKGQDSPKNLRINLNKLIDVFFVFLTTEVGEDGVIRFYDDTYEQNKKLLRAGAWGG